MYQCEAKSVLLLEGSDDCNIISKFCEGNTIRADFGFCNCGGDNQVLHKLNALLKKSDPPEVIGVILDADQNIDERYQEIKAKVADFYNLPKNMPKDGLVHLEKGWPKLGIWIMPNNQDNGALEEFYLELATDIDTAFIDNTIQEAEKKELTSFKSQHRKKAIMHTYFAWQDTPGMPLHAAINKIVLDNNAEIAHVFKGWLISLFN